MYDGAEVIYGFDLSLSKVHNTEEIISIPNQHIAGFPFVSITYEGLATADRSIQATKHLHRHGKCANDNKSGTQKIHAEDHPY